MCCSRVALRSRSRSWNTMCCDVRSQRSVRWGASKRRIESAVKVLNLRIMVWLQVRFEAQHAGFDCVTHREQVESPRRALFGNAPQNAGQPKRQVVWRRSSAIECRPKVYRRDHVEEQGLPSRRHEHAVSDTMACRDCWLWHLGTDRNRVCCSGAGEGSVQQPGILCLSI